MEESILHYIRPKAPFLWVDGADRLPNSYYLFRAEFTVEEDDNPSSLWICARKKYRLYINDKLIGQGLPPAVEYGNIIDCHAVARELLPGSKNCLAVEVHDMEGSGEACFIAWLENADGTLYMGLSEKDIQVLPARCGREIPRRTVRTAMCATRNTMTRAVARLDGGCRGNCGNVVCEKKAALYLSGTVRNCGYAAGFG